MRVACVFLFCAVACGPLGVSGTPTDTEGETVTVFCKDGPLKVDVLFVVDDASSMADEAARIAENSRVFGTIFDAPDMNLDLRVAVTRTTARDGGLGELVASSCRERADDFRLPARAGTSAADAFTEGCEQTCALDHLGLLPVALDDGPAIVRPWLQQIRSSHMNFMAENVPGVLGCMLPVGVAGRGQRSPIGAMRAALARSIDARDPAFGWMREDAMLLAVLITDGDEEADPALPLRVALELGELQDAKRELDPAAIVAVGIVAGWDTRSQVPHPSGCGSYRQLADAPLRLDALRRAAPELVIRTPSICGDDFTPALEPLARPLGEQIRPWCIPHCVEIGAAGPSCRAELRESSPTGGPATVHTPPSCMQDDDGWTLPDDADRCVAFVHDDELDNSWCFDRGSNVEARLLVREGAPLLADACLEVTCEQADDPSTVCPSLP